jgi:acetyltransferase-like isoleucine patch superfamily enzyme
MNVKDYILRHYLLRRIAIAALNIKRCFNFGGVTVLNHGCARLRKDCSGKNNTIEIKEGAYLAKPTIRIRGNNNKIVFGKNVTVGPQCSFWMEGSNNTIIIGDNTTFTCKVHFNAQEHNTDIIVGEDCMFSNTIIVRTSDSHPIYDMKSNSRINPAKSISIGDHVWIAPNTKIMKGAIIGDGSIIGSDSMVTKTIPSNCLAVGHPAKVVKENIKWTRENIIT